jgi:hypothetical protein
LSRKNAVAGFLTGRQRPVDSGFAISYTRRMKMLLVLAILCMVPFAVSAHPGKTDWRGGHKCIKGCEERGLFYGEYHLHDKDGRTIRINGKKVTPGRAAMQSAATETRATPPVTSTTQTVTVYHSVTDVREDNIFASDPLLWTLLALLLLLLIIRTNRKREER